MRARVRAYCSANGLARVREACGKPPPDYVPGPVFANGRPLFPLCCYRGAAPFSPGYLTGLEPLRFPLQEGADELAHGKPRVRPDADQEGIYRIPV